MDQICFLGFDRAAQHLCALFKESFPDTKIVGYAEDVVQRDQMQSGTLVDDVLDEAKVALKDAVLVVIGAPYGRTLQYISLLADDEASPQTVLDTLPVKRPVLDHGEEVLPASTTHVSVFPFARSSATDYTLLISGAGLSPTSSLAKVTPELASMVEGHDIQHYLLEPTQNDTWVARNIQIPLICRSLLDEATEEDAVEAMPDLKVMSPHVLGETAEHWFGALVANQGTVLDGLSGLSSGVQRARNRIIQEDQEFGYAIFERLVEAENDESL